MMDLLIYEGKVAVALLVFYLFYRFLLKKETFHRFNRVVLVGTAVLSFLLPLCIITIRKPVEMDPQITGQAVALPELSAAEIAPVAEPSAPWWPTALAVLFWAGVAFVLVRVAVSILCIARIVRRGECVREEDGCKVIVTDRDLDPFSWMRYIVLSRMDWEGDHAPILAHEKAHIAYRHSVELLLVDVMSALQWFNPAIWMLRADLQELHEYEADDAVLRSGANLREYQYLLIRKAVSKSGYSVANSFNHSILKNRITMMSKSKSSLVRGLRALYLLPLICLGIGLQARTVYVPKDKDSNFLSPNEMSPENPQKVITIRISADAAADGEILIDGKGVRMDKLPAYFASLENPSDVVAQIETDGDALAYEMWANIIKGMLRDAGVQKAQYRLAGTPLIILRQAWGEEKEITKAEYDALSQSRINSIQMLKDEAAFKKYGDKASHGVIVVNLKAPMEMEEIVVVSYRDQEEELIPFRLLPDPDHMPRFQGGDLNEFSKWLCQRVYAPKDCNHSGTMRVSFEVLEDGSVGDVQVLESVCPELDAIVTNLIRESPKWEPGKTKDGKAIATNLKIPIIFQVRSTPKK